MYDRGGLVGPGISSLTNLLPLASGCPAPRRWIATNCVDFYNEVSILYELCAEDAEARFQHPGDGFPPNFEYRWADAKNPKPIRCTSGEYVSHVLSVS